MQLNTLAILFLTLGLTGCNGGEASQDVAEPDFSDEIATPRFTQESEVENKNGAGCDASKAEWMIGKEPTEELLQQGAADAGAEKSRYLAHDIMVTMEYHPSRLNVDLNEDGVIRGVRCG